MARKAGDLGLFGAWLNPYYPDRQRIEFAAELEDLGFRTIWLGGGRESMGDLRLYEAALRATREATIVPAIINMWREPAETVAEGYHRVRSEFGDRLLLGIGAGHPESYAGYERPYAKLTDYLDRPCR
jgi:alkanesulfonate monooxygenase SsuD/methylene tetrahydromethanopterin reductase-like flavin-dependent oxidoreductase (luciferase family)